MNWSHSFHLESCHVAAYLSYFISLRKYQDFGDEKDINSSRGNFARVETGEHSGSMWKGDISNAVEWWIHEDAHRNLNED